MDRRTFLAAGLGAAGLGAAPSTAIIDTHTHFYDTTRPEGVPWPAETETLLYRPVLPEEFREMTAPLGVTGTIVIEASAWVEDNQWILDLADHSSVIVGTVGHLTPGDPHFRSQLERFHQDARFRGIRVGIGRNPAVTELPARMVEDLKLLSEAGLELDAIGPPAMLAQLVGLTDKIPDLRIVIDHLPFDPPEDATARASYQAALRELGKRKRVYAKVSNVLRRVDGKVPEDLAYYKPSLDELWEVFGEDRVVYGSNWPVSDKVAPYPLVLRIVQEYFRGKGPVAYAKYFHGNAKSAYRWPEAE